VVAQDIQRNGMDRLFVPLYERGKDLLFTTYYGSYQFGVCSHYTAFLNGGASTHKSSIRGGMRRKKGSFRDGIPAQSVRSHLDGQVASG
jgi:hypothetical protein